MFKALQTPLRCVRRLGFRAEDQQTVKEHLIPGPAGHLNLRVYTPAAPNEIKLSALLFIHGGGFVMGSLDSHDNVCRAFASAVPCVVIAVDYR